MIVPTRTDWVRHQYELLRSLTVRGQLDLAFLLALSPQNDPYNCLQRGRAANGQWFGEQWRAYGKPGLHVRRFHYRLISQPSPPQLLNGKPFENTDGCWQFLLSASANARYLDLVEATDFAEHRTAAPSIYAPGCRVPPEPSVEVGETAWTRPTLDDTEIILPTLDAAWTLPTVNAKITLPTLDLTVKLPTICPAKLSLPDVSLDDASYDYADEDQPFSCEVWIEKSTMNDVLDPLCKSLRVNFVPGVGFSSITRAVEMLATRATKPVRIFYLCDFDPAGGHMPVSTARQIEFWCNKYAPDVDIKLTPLALTVEQVREYQLPRIPIKASDKRKARFEERYGEGAVELDALEALHPGELARIVRTALEPYRDRTLRGRLDEVRRDAEQQVIDDWETATADERQRLATLQEAIAAVTAQVETQLQEALAPLQTAIEDTAKQHEQALQAALAPLQAEVEAIAAKFTDQLTADLEPLQTEAEELQQAIRDRAAEFQESAPDALPDRPQPEVTVPDEADWLFDASRDYVQQLAYYKHISRNGHDEEREEHL